MQYRLMTFLIEATQWHKNGDHPRDYATSRDGFENGVFVTFPANHGRELGWEGSVVRYYRHPFVPGQTSCVHCSRTMHEHGWIDTPEGGRVVCPGDWIITDRKGEHYPCKPDIFAALCVPI